MKKYLLMLMLSMINVITYAADGDHVPQLVITQNDPYSVKPGNTRFSEPTISVTSVTDGHTTVLTNQYNIKYYISGHEEDNEAKMATNSRKAKVTTDAATGTQVELLFGDVVFGDKEGDVTISIKATNKTNSSEVLAGSYTVTVSHPAPTFAFSPNFAKGVADADVINLFVKQTVKRNEWTPSQFDVTLTDASAGVPTVKVSIDANGVQKDITDCYIITTSLIGGDATGSQNVLKMEVTEKGKTIKYVGTGQYGGSLSADDEEIAKTIFHDDATLRYSFVLKDEFTGKYPAIADKDVAIVFNKVVSDQKIPLHLELTRDMILLDNVEKANFKGTDNDADKEFVLHVYKYGEQNHDPNGGKYQYCTPNPAILTEGRASLPIYCTRGTGGYGDFSLFYELIDGDSKNVITAPDGETRIGTYYDDCQVAPFHPTGDIQKPGESTGLTVSEDKFQTGKPGLVRVRVYAVLSKSADSRKAELYDLYQPIMVSNGEGGLKEKVLKNQWGAEYIVYTEPVDFYIDVMKRIPTLSFAPDPSTLTFGKGDRIDMNNRFDVSGSIDEGSNGISGNLKWGANMTGTEVDHFAYTFFISQHAAQVIKVHDWPCTFTKADEHGKIVADWDAWAANTWTHPYTGETFHGDQYSYVSYQKVKEGDKIANSALAHPMVGDKILVDGNLIEVTDANYNKYKDRGINAGDMLKGTTYFSVKGYGDKFELWYMTFDYEGQYDITYTIRPWNHVRWDVGNDEAGSVTYQYNIEEKVKPVIELSYYQTVTGNDVKWDFDEPYANVIVPSSRTNVTNDFNLHYVIDATEAHDSRTISDETIEGVHAGSYSVLKDGANVVLKINKATGEVYVGDIVTDVKIQVSATLKNSENPKYYEPDAVNYTISIKDLSGNAKWDIISTCRTNNPDEEASSNPRFTIEQLKQESGRFHFIGAGTIVGGTQVKGVPGITMTIGANGDNDWQAVESTIKGLKICCNHENKPVAIYSNTVRLDNEGIPTGGAFYQFNPSANGYLSIDANWQTGNSVNLVTKNSKTAEVSFETIDVTENAQGDKTFTKPLIAGETYYLYNATEGNLRFHGFKYEPAFVTGTSTTKADSNTGIVASLFMNGFASNVPTIAVAKNEKITYKATVESDGSDASNYVEIGADGQLTPKKMTIDASGNIFQLKVTATIKSTDPSVDDGGCTAKTTFYYLEIIDIPTYRIEDLDTYNDNDGITNRQKVRTTNIPTAMTMTFGGWVDEDDQEYSGGKSDQWSYKSAAGAASRIGSELDDDDPTYNITIDGFDYFSAGNQNPVDENAKSALVAELNKDKQPQRNNGNSYNFASGTDAEATAGDTYYNTTYTLPCSGAYLKFEPQESGTVLVYIVQNGSVDYHRGIANVEKQYQLKWRPLYITDETGKPCEMIDDANFSDISKYLPTKNKNENIGAFTLGLSRCNKQEEAIAEAAAAAGVSDKCEGCDFDWTEFRGTTTDRNKLLDAWADKGDEQKIIRLENGGFALPHKAYVRYAFNVKAGKTYFVFQPGSKFEFGGFSFVPVGYPAHSKYGLTWQSKTDKVSECMTWVGNENDPSENQESDETIYWTNSDSFTELKENKNITVIDGAEGSGKIARTFTADYWTGLCLPFSVSEIEATRVFGDKYVLVTFDGYNSKGQLHFTRHANHYIEAGRPYLIYPKKNGEFVFHNVTIEGNQTVKAVNTEWKNLGDPKLIDKKLVDPTRFNVKANDFTFKGIYTQEDMPKGSYFAAKDGLYRYSADSTIGGYRAYFSLPQGGNAKAILFTIDDKSRIDDEDSVDNIATGIIYIDNDDVRTYPVDCSVYSINGQKLGTGVDALNRMTKGVYIVNGKKITVK